METQNWIQIGALLCALLVLAVRQYLVLRSEQRREQRLITKFRVFWAIRSEGMSFGDIRREMLKMEHTSTNEVIKALYEMLRDQTVRFTEADKFQLKHRPPR